MLARAVTIAVRYLSIRRQFRDRDSDLLNGPEISALDYTTVQIRVLPLLATTFALHYSGKAMLELFERVRSGSNALEGDQVQLAELHVTSAGLKSLATELAANGIETCRRAMGGHGFGGGTGLVQLNADYLAKPTVEGDNWMITQQVARHLLKTVGQVMHGKSNPKNQTEKIFAAYQRYNSQPPLFSSLDNPSNIVEAFRCRTSYLAFEAYEKREVQRWSWNSLLVHFHKLSRAYSQTMLVANFWEALQALDLRSVATMCVLKDVFRLFAFGAIDADAREFQRSGAVSLEFLDQLPDQILALMEEIRPHAVRLVDSFALPDYLLDSALGRYDGRVYEDLYHRAHVLNPLNRTTFNPNYKDDEIVMGSGDGFESVLAKL